MESFIVVGAGVLGASTAYRLAKEGASVTIIDGKDLGQATDAAAGIVCPWLSQRRNKIWYRLAKGGAAYYPALMKELQADGETETGYKRVGAISLHTDEQKLEKMVERAKKRREDAPEIGEITRLSASETKNLFPPLADEYGAVHVSGAARVDGRALRTALIRAAERNGATVRRGKALLLHENKRVKGVEVEDEALYADKVIVTSGVWAKHLLKPLGIQFAVSSQKAQIVHLELPNTDTSTWPVVMPPNDQYLLSFENGRVVAGATHENDVGLDDRITAGGIFEIFDKALDYAPGLKDSTFLETRVGFRPFTPGFLPVFGALPGFEGILAANGLGASGLTSGPYLGDQLAKLALNQQTELDPEDYDIQGALDFTQ
ncbi:FAD-binding oxidoreductase [Halobacillus rhizosphaerae]|uniref:NAD(P)/FAD-dependent oxidoreductase n=1 Tax=Halobacillus rhizosphaerae TaxID=3064889 RepID=UPI00398B8079